jgi:hypothetical protein
MLCAPQVDKERLVVPTPKIPEFKAPSFKLPSFKMPNFKPPPVLKVGVGIGWADGWCGGIHHGSLPAVWRGGAI